VEKDEAPREDGRSPEGIYAVKGFEKGQVKLLGLSFDEDCWYS
jgi:hypothetical protein